jgi:peptidoglycan L-alanyl-D-glutamate endopeptidase CwlK
MGSRKISDLHPKMQSLYAAFDHEMKKADIDYIVTCTYRSNDEQNDLYRDGRTEPGNIITNAQGGESAHNFTIDGKPAALAFDIAIFRNGKLDWNAKNPGWQSAGQLGLIVGLDWAGVWKRFREYPHFQLPKWRLET